MSEHSGPTKVLITVMTYPHPSRGYQELECRIQQPTLF
jgi:hypothetical protein